MYTHKNNINNQPTAFIRVRGSLFVAGSRNKKGEKGTINVYTHVMDEFKRKEAAKFSLFPTF